MQKKNYYLLLAVIALCYSIHSPAYAMDSTENNGEKRKRQESPLPQEEVPPFINKMMSDSLSFSLSQAEYIKTHSELIHLPDHAGNTPLHWICSTPEGESMLTLMEELIESGASLELKNNKDYTPLLLAVIHKKIKIIEFFIEKCRTEIQNNDGISISLFHLAASQGHLEIIQAFLQAGISFETQDKHHRTPIHLAIKNGITAAVRAFIQAGANLETKDAADRTPLHIAVSAGHSDITYLLIQAGANSDVKNFYKQTLLHLTAISTFRDQKIFSILTQTNPSTSVRDQKGRTALHLAILGGNSEIATLLIKYDTKNLQHKFLKKPKHAHTALTALELAKTSPHASKLKKWIQISEALIAFQTRNTKELIAHLEAEKEIDLELLENDLIQTPFDRNNLQSFAKELQTFLWKHNVIAHRNTIKLQLGLAIEKNNSDNTYESINLILNTLNKRLLGKLEDLCLRKLQLCLSNTGKYSLNPVAQANGITKDNAFQDSETEATTLNAFIQNKQNLEFIFTTGIPSADKLFTRSPKEFLIKSMDSRP